MQWAAPRHSCDGLTEDFGWKSDRHQAARAIKRHYRLHSGPLGWPPRMPSALRRTRRLNPVRIHMEIRRVVPHKLNFTLNIIYAVAALLSSVDDRPAERSLPRQPIVDTEPSESGAEKRFEERLPIEPPAARHARATVNQNRGRKWPGTFRQMCVHSETNTAGMGIINPLQLRCTPGCKQQETRHAGSNSSPIRTYCLNRKFPFAPNGLAAYAGPLRRLEIGDVLIQQSSVFRFARKAA